MREQVSKKTLFFYALPALPLALLGLPLYIYLPTFYVSNVGLGVSEVGIWLFLSRLFDMLNDPLIGLLSDRKNERKKLMILGVIILLIGFYALTHPPKAYLALWLFSFSLLAYTGWSLISIPYLTLGAELNPDYHDNTKLSSARESFNIIGLLIALILPYALHIAEDAQKTITLMWNLVVVMMPVMIGLSLWKLHPVKSPKTVLPFWNSLRTFWKENAKSRALFIAFLLNSLANALPATLFLFYVSLVLQEPSFTGLLLILYFGAGIVALPFWIKLSHKKGKHFSWVGSMSLASFAFVFVPFLGQGDMHWFILITLVSGLSLGADMALPASIQADIAQKSQTEGNTLSGLLFGIWALLTKLSLAMAVGIAFGILGLVGFEPKAPTQNALLTLSLLYGLFPVLFKLLAIYTLKDFQEPQKIN